MAAGLAVEAPPIAIFGAVTASAAILLAAGLVGSARKSPSGAPDVLVTAPA